LFRRAGRHSSPETASSAEEVSQDQADPLSLATPRETADRPAVTLDSLSTRISAQSAVATGDLQPIELDVTADLDPRLQLAIANRRTGKPGQATASTDSGEVAVIAKVSSASSWQALPDILPGAVLGQATDGNWLVTGRIPIAAAESIRRDPNVISLKAAQPVSPTLGATIEAMEVAATKLPPGVQPNGGRGVVLGIVDFGCDFAHGNFRRKDGTTRIESIWDQAGVARPDSPFGYGRLHTSQSIDAALQKPQPYSVLGYGPDPDSPGRIGTHGTHVMDIAGGNGFGSGQAGVAPEATLIFVEAAINDIAWAGPAAVEQFFGDSVQLLEAVRFIFDRAGDRPCVVNLSLGTNGGPHDGTSLVEQGLDALAEERPNRAIVIAASNSQQDGIHAFGQVQGRHDLLLRQLGSGGGELELWYSGNERLDVELVAPDGTSFGPVSPGSNLPLGAGGQVSIFISNRLDDPNNHDNVIGIWIAEGLVAGDWNVRLTAAAGAAVDYHAWIERNDRAQASFAVPVPTHTLGSISTGRQSIVVGSYDGHKPGMPLSGFSSCGPTRDGREKPELSAPGHHVMAARSRTRSGVVRKSGTSMAAPAVSGLVALVLAEARRTGTSMTIAQLRQRLFGRVRRNPPPPGAWDARYGYGRASGEAV
jgi:subtilisin family serine protease